MVDALSQSFTQAFGVAPTLLICSPGRVNLIGEHTDYNEGFVLPAAIDKAIYLAISARPDKQVHFIAHDLNSTYQGQIGQLVHSDKDWANYLLGVIDQLQQAGYSLPQGINVAFSGNLPIGAGVSSSAALENAIGFALNELFNFGLDRITLLKLSQRAENEFVGAKVGIMDMFASMMGRAGHVIKLDCRSLEYAYAPLNMTGIRIVLCDSRVKHSLASSEYNTRRAECEAGVKILQAFYGAAIHSLRDVTMEMLDKHLRATEPLLYERCSYVVEENERLLTGVAQLEAGDVAAFGQQMYGSHEGLSKKYEVSCFELDTLVDIARHQDGVFGARMMGGGFGGCTINLVQESHLADFEQTMQREYKQRTGKDTLLYVCTLENGTHLIAD